MASQDTTENSKVPFFVQNGMPGEFHRILDALDGVWHVDKELFIAGGSAEKPTISSGMTARRTWIGASAKHILDITEGMVGGSSYYRLGVLGFSNVDHRYEWVTFDGLNANMMSYQSPPVDKPSNVIVTSGVFTDQGLLGEESVGKRIPMRTVLTIENMERHAIELYFTPPDRDEILIDRSRYSRTNS